LHIKAVLGILAVNQKITGAVVTLCIVYTLSRNSDHEGLILAARTLYTLPSVQFVGFDSFADKWLLYEQERKLQKAEGRIESLIDSKDEKVSLQASIFVAETLGKDRGYSKRQELTGRNAKDLIPKTLSELEKVELRKLLV
jgi:hypothetical protein